MNDDLPILKYIFYSVFCLIYGICFIVGIFSLYFDLFTFLSRILFLSSE